jgi:hypothetical protein
MAYAQFGTIEATDFNTRAGGNPTTTSTTVNAVWATGGGQTGYGQAAVSNVTVAQTVAATNWASLINSINSANAHQGASSTGLTAPVAGGTVTFLSGLGTAITNINSNKGNAVAVGTTISNAQTTASSWTNYANFTFTTRFANGDAARYFFNAGGQISFSVTHSNNAAGINAAMNALANAVGTIVMSGQNSGNRTIAGNVYNGITKVGGSGTVDTIASSNGYFGLSTGNIVIFDQNSGISPYTTTVQIYANAFTNGANLSGNNDNGNVVTLHVIMDKISGNGTLGSGSVCTGVVTPPSTGNIANTWGTITFEGSNTVA